MSTATRRPRLLFLVTEDYYFISHRLELAIAAQRAGFDVSVATRVREGGDAIRQAGVRLVPFEMARGSLNPWTDIHTLVRLVGLYRREHPDVVHHVAMKPVLYGSLAAGITRVPRVINALSGMGWLFTSGTGIARWLKRPVRWGLRHAVSRGVALVQNRDDARLLAELGVPERAIRHVAGAGVDLRRFRPTAAAPGPVVVLFPARLLWDKGIGEFVAAARLLRQESVTARFVVAGAPDPMNPASIDPREIRAWVQEGTIEHAGWVADMPALLANCHVVCLPSYREGLPKSLIEAAAAGKPIVTTNVPGCREVVGHGDNGLLVRAGDAPGLAEALRQLIEDPTLRATMGRRGRARAEAAFGMERIIEQTLSLYREPVA